MTLKLPRGIAHTLEHNEHKAVYESILLHLRENDIHMTQEDRDECVRTDELWSLFWHPDTPVGSCCVYAPTLERLLELAAEQEGP